MKKKTHCFLIFIVISVYPSFSGIGIKVGLNTVKLVINELSYNSLTYPSFVNATLFYNFKIVRKFSIQPELEFFTTGFKVNKTIYSEQVDIKETYSFLRIPILIKFEFISFGKLKLVLYSGFYKAFNLKADQQVECFGNIYSDSLKDLMKRSLTGFTAGVELILKPCVGSVLLGFRYSSAGNIYKNDLTPTRISDKSFIVYVGFMIGK